MQNKILQLHNCAYSPQTLRGMVLLPLQEWLLAEQILSLLLLLHQIPPGQGY